MKIKGISVIIPVIFLITVNNTAQSSAQPLSAGTILPLFNYGIAGGISSSSFSSDSAGYTGVAMPYGGLFLRINMTPKINLTTDLQYIIKGVNRDSPYQRYRYSYFNIEVMTGYTLAGFLSFSAGYRYGFENSAKIVILNGNNPSGVERSIIKGFGNYGQFIAGSSIYVSNTSAITLKFGFPGKGIPMTHFQIGLRLTLGQKGPSRKMTEKTIKRKAAEMNAGMLRDGILLVRLNSMRSSINALQEHGRVSEAERLKTKTHSENINLINAFSKYTFSKVLFFYDYNSNLVREGRLDTILLNSKLDPVQPDTPTGPVFTAHLGDYTSPDRIYHLRRDPQYLKENRIAPDSTAAFIQYSHQASRIGGIVIMDQQFELLENPFPSYTPVINQRILKPETRLERAVIKLNEALMKLYFDN